MSENEASSSNEAVLTSDEAKKVQLQQQLILAQAQRAQQYYLSTLVVSDKKNL